MRNGINCVAGDGMATADLIGRAAFVPNNTVQNVYRQNYNWRGAVSPAMPMNSRQPDEIA